MALVQVDGVLGLVSKVAAVDEGAARELVRLGLYETLCDQIDVARPYVDRDMASYLAKRSEQNRQTLVKEFIARRLDGESVEDVLLAAQVVHTVGKAADDPKTSWWDARDALGRFTSGAKAYSASRAADRDDPFDQERYSVLRATGAALQSAHDPTVSALGGLAQAVGVLGPEAERVLRPGLTRVAYRYRGTEKRPSKRLKNALKNGKAAVESFVRDPVHHASVMAGLRDAEIRGQALAGRPADQDASTQRTRPETSTAIAVTNYWTGKKNLTPDQVELRVLGDIGASYLSQQLPSPEATAISIAAGAVPPSKGVLIDADGDVVSEAIGFNGDHYLPFDLKNLRSLNGGQYVRTRAVGGPTTEDIYTALLTGSRQVQVVSHSGVFTLEFDPDLRGGRRYTDKARQMVRRYERLLDAIHHSDKSELYQRDLPPQRKREITQELSAANPRMDPADLKKLIKDQVDRERVAGSFKMKTDDELEEQARTDAQAWFEQSRRTGPPPSRQAQARFLAGRFEELKAENRRESVKRFQLDGDGYGAALKALREEYPYFIRSVDYEPLPEFHNARELPSTRGYTSAADQGYVPPKGHGPTAVAALGTVATSVSTKQRPYAQRQGRFRGGSPEAQPDAATTAVRQEGGEAKPTAATSPRLDQLDVNNATLHIVAGNYMSKITDLVGALSESMGNDGGEQLPPWDPDLHGIASAPEEEIDGPGFTPQQKIRYAMEKAAAGGYGNSGKGYVRYLLNPGTPESVVTAVLQALDDGEHGDVPLLNAVHGKRMVVPNEDEIRDAAGKLRTVLLLRKPFEKGDLLTYDPAETGKPVEIPQVAVLGTDPSAYEAFYNKAKANDPALADYVEDYRGDGAVDPVDDISDTLVELGQVQAGKATEGVRDQQHIAEELLRKQTAFAFVYAERLANAYRDIFGLREGGGPKAKGGVTKAASPYQLGTRRRVLVHPPGSVLATEFRKFLSTSRRSPAA